MRWKSQHNLCETSVPRAKNVLPQSTLYNRERLVVGCTDGDTGSGCHPGNIALLVENIFYPHQRHIYYTIMISFSDCNASVAQLNAVKSYWRFKFIPS